MKRKDIITTRHLEEALQARTEIQREWLVEAVNNPIKTFTQTDGRIRHWIYIEEMSHYLRVVTLDDGVTVLTAHLDRRFKE